MLNLEKLISLERIDSKIGKKSNNYNTSSSIGPNERFGFLKSGIVEIFGLFLKMFSFWMKMLKIFKICNFLKIVSVKFLKTTYSLISYTHLKIIYIKL